MRLLDLFCGAGGCTKGYQQAGFVVRGVDISRQPRYCGEEFIQADALEYLKELIQSGEIEEFDAIHASPPCQAFSSMRTMPNAKPHDDKLTPTREILNCIEKPCVIENVEGAPIFNLPLLGIHAVTLCGTMFGLHTTAGAELRRHRLFETLRFVCSPPPPCRHDEIAEAVIGVYGGHGRDRRRRPRTITVVGNSGGSSTRDGVQEFSVDERREAMAIDWMSGAELSQAIPPAYTEFIGKQLINQLEQIKKAA
ncbi:MAG: DNA cytosine methyltransferase [Desulfurellales bacterium]|nr:MAG: DNA cytosine methyltransferase [Desulfurellales bacterium]